MTPRFTRQQPLIDNHVVHQIVPDDNKRTNGIRFSPTHAKLHKTARGKESKRKNTTHASGGGGRRSCFPIPRCCTTAGDAAFHGSSSLELSLSSSSSSIAGWTVCMASCFPILLPNCLPVEAAPPPPGGGPAKGGGGDGARSCFPRPTTTGAGRGAGRASCLPREAGGGGTGARSSSSSSLSSSLLVSSLDSSSSSSLSGSGSGLRMSGAEEGGEGGKGKKRKQDMLGVSL